MTGIFSHLLYDWHTLYNTYTTGHYTITLIILYDCHIYKTDWYILRCITLCLICYMLCTCVSNQGRWQKCSSIIVKRRRAGTCSTTLSFSPRSHYRASEKLGWELSIRVHFLFCSGSCYAKYYDVYIVFVLHNYAKFVVYFDGLLKIWCLNKKKKKKSHRYQQLMIER